MRGRAHDNADGDDCGVADCPAGCSGRGVCELEYPVSHCDCEPPASGADCAATDCPNNCSGRGACRSDGSCDCAAPRNPYDAAQSFVPFAGDDCSLALPFSAASAPSLAAAALALAAAAAAWLAA